MNAITEELWIRLTNFGRARAVQAALRDLSVGLNGDDDRKSVATIHRELEAIIKRNTVPVEND